MSDAAAPGTLYVVSTPIGNMGDFSFRAVDVLRSVNADSRRRHAAHARHLLDRYEINDAVVAYHEHNEAKTTPRLVARLRPASRWRSCRMRGRRCCPIPARGWLRAAIDAGVPVVPIPGASALLAALVASGLDADRFTFFGFLTRSA